MRPDNDPGRVLVFPVFTKAADGRPHGGTHRGRLCSDLAELVHPVVGQGQDRRGAISQPGLLMDRWYPATVPATVLGTLVQNNVHADLYFGDNLKNIPADDFKVSWWYRTEFPLTADPSKAAFKLEFDGINYRANIWLNGKKIADASEAYGAFRRFEFDVTAAGHSAAG